MPTQKSQEDSRTLPGFAVVLVHHKSHQQPHVSWPSVLFSGHTLLHRQAHVTQPGDVPQKAFGEASTNSLNDTGQHMLKKQPTVTSLQSRLVLVNQGGQCSSVCIGQIEPCMDKCRDAVCLDMARRRQSRAR